MPSGAIRVMEVKTPVPLPSELMKRMTGSIPTVRPETAQASVFDGVKRQTAKMFILNKEVAVK
jgi:hypothetical protein